MDTAKVNLNTKFAGAVRTVVLGGITLANFGFAYGDDDVNLLDPPLIPPSTLSLDEANQEVPYTPSVSNENDNSIAEEAVTLDDIVVTQEETVASDSESIRERYEDGSIKVERVVTLDENSNYVNNGPYRLFSRDGNLIAEGNFIMGHRDGTWSRIYATKEAKIFNAYPYNEFQAPFVSKAEFEVGNLHGTWVINDAQGKIVSEIPLRNGFRHGRAIWNHPNGKLMYEANYNDGMLEGKMAEYDEAGNEVASHKFEAGRRVEREIEHFSNHQVKAEYEYLSAQQDLKEKDDWWAAKPAVYETVGKRVKHGKFTEWHPNGQKKATGSYEQDRLAGSFASYFENGQRETQGGYALGTPDGSWTWWHPNGMRRAQGSYANGTPDGAWTSWSNDGKLAKRQSYSDAPQGSSIVRSRNIRRNNAQSSQPRRSYR